jgi:hypothetical protein
MRILLLLLPLVAFAADPLPVVVCAGQSNMVGKRLKPAALPAELQGPIADAWCWDNTGAWIPVEAGKTPSSDGGFGPEISFAAAAPKPIGIIKFAKGGTNLHGQWSPTDDVSLYTQLVRHVKAAQASRPIVIVGMLWMQGESDSSAKNVAVMAPAYAVNLANLIQRARADFAAPDMVFIAGRVNPDASKYPGAEQVRAAIQGCPLPRYGWIDLDPLSKLGDNLHYDVPGTVEMGRLFATRLAELRAAP